MVTRKENYGNNKREVRNRKKMRRKKDNKYEKGKEKMKRDREI
jgi:hypothetical protein